ncbi:hypothetical protein [Enterococcus lemanii]|uniref:DUF4145 domain-containing protein n=1 Tax=Enterococcus lemanii TaxID=1159752 RepID=A0ABV9MZ38_9ENTE|nr:hypothetical protein [Enterococcus lemanii]MBM7707936.1 hypothetical protein [Enterococcus lemanii]
MSEGTILIPFDRILSGYDKITEISVSINDCSKLCQRYQHLGVQGYRLGDFRGVTYLNRYLNCSVTQAPMLIYRDKYLIPLVFRQSEDTFRLFEESLRLEGFFYLLDWFLANRPAAILVKDTQSTNRLTSTREKIIDTAFLTFRLAEILDGAGFPLSKFTRLEEFVDWNRVNRLIDNGGIGRHSRIFDEENQQNMSELAVILKIIQLKYPTTLASLA